MREPPAICMRRRSCREGGELYCSATIALADEGSSSGDDANAGGGGRKRAGRHSHHRVSKRKTSTSCEVSLWCESDIFEAIGLSYVPPFLRFFHSPAA